MKKYLILLAVSLTPIVSQAQEVKTYNKLLKKYVTKDGVEYKKWSKNKDDKKALGKVLKDWSKVKTKKLSKKEKAAFRINLYNAAMLDVVLDHYPLKSVTKLGKKDFSIFDKKIIDTSSGKISLNTLEKKQLIKEFKDPRIHFAVNCASVSCPPLRNEAFNAKKLNDQLNEQTKLFANSERAVKNGKYSELFNWYAKDFGTKDPAEYLNIFRDKKVKTAGKVKWIKYDWDLNSAK